MLQSHRELNENTVDNASPMFAGLVWFHGVLDVSKGGRQVCQGRCHALARVRKAEA